MSSSDNSLAARSGTYLNSLVDYVLEVKPYRTKINTRNGAVSESYLFSDSISVAVKDSVPQDTIFLGPDTLDRTTIKTLTDAERVQYGLRGYSRPYSNSWQQEIISDGQRLIYPIANVSIPKFASNSSLAEFISGPRTIIHNPADNLPPVTRLDDYQGIVGLTRGVFNQQRWDGIGITDVRKNGVHQQDTVDYYLSHGVFGFDVFPPSSVGASPMWMQHNVNNVPSGTPAFSSDVASLYYSDVTRTYGTITEIKDGDYEEWVVEITAIVPNTSVTMKITGYQNGIISTPANTKVFNWPSATKQQYVSPKISFYYEKNPQVGDLTTPVVGGKWVLTPGSKITVHPTAGQETWSLIKTNPSVFVNGGHPIFTPAVPRANLPSIEVHTTTLSRTNSQVGSEIPWTITFIDSTTYKLECSSLLTGYPKTISLLDGCSFRDDNVGFTLIPSESGWRAGDLITWTTGKPTHYKVFGSVTGWSHDATVGEWYWNGKIGFKIPALDYYTTLSSTQFSTQRPVNVLTEPSTYTITFTEPSSNVTVFTYTLNGSNTVMGIDNNAHHLRVAEKNNSLVTVKINGVPTTNFTIQNSVIKFPTAVTGTVQVTTPAFRGSATVFNDQYGYRQALEVNTPWSDEYVAFTINTSGGQFNVGDQVLVIIAPSFTFINDNKNITVPYLMNSEIFPLHHSHGAVIFPSIANGDKITIDKAFFDKTFLKIKNAESLYPDLGTESDYIPLYFKLSDRATQTSNGLVPTSTAAFSDLATYIQAYSAATNQLAFTIVSPRFEKSNRSSQSTLTFSKAFSEKYLPFNTRYSIDVLPESSFSQHINVKFSENLKVYERIALKIFDPVAVHVVDKWDNNSFTEVISALYLGEGPATGYWRYQIVNIAAGKPYVYKLVFVTPATDPHDQAWLYPFSIKLTEGGALLLDNYDTDGYDDGLYDQPTLFPLAAHAPAITVAENIVSGRTNPSDLHSPATLEKASTSIAEGLSILQTVVDVQNPYDIWNYDTDTYDLAGDSTIAPGYKILNVLYNFKITQPLGTVVPTTAPGLLITTAADLYSVSLQNRPSISGTWVVAPESNHANLSSGTVVYNTSADGTIVDTNTFNFSLPVGVAVPFRLWVI